MLRIAVCSLILSLLMPHSLKAQWHAIGSARAQTFEHKGWSDLPLILDFDPQTEAARVRFSHLSPGRPLNARLDYQHLPHYSDWVAQRQAEGGATWAALKALLDEVGNGPVVAMVHEAVPKDGPAQVLIGLRRGSRFDLYATVPGHFSPCGLALCFEPGTPLYASKTSALVWGLLKPLVMLEAKTAAKR